MKRLAMVLLFLVCAAGAAEHSQIHISSTGMYALIVGAVLAFFEAWNDD